MTNSNIIQKDVISWARAYQGPPFMAMLTDPPYHLTSITKRFGRNGSAPVQYGKDGAYQRASSGFMGQEWDGGDVAFRPETWAALAEHLYPGAFGMAFASSRGQHRMACAIEDAGLIIHPTIVYAFGSGFPKATRIKAPTYALRWNWLSRLSNWILGKIGNPPRYNLPDIWESYRYGGQVLKPALEFIIVFQKPYSGRPIDNITETGAGALNVEDGRIGLELIPKHTRGKSDFRWRTCNEGGITPEHQGRWPSNLILDDSDEVRAMFPETKSGTGSFKRSSAKGYSPNTYGAESRPEGTPNVEYGDEGGAARFFHQTNWNYEAAEALNNADPIHYCAKPGRKERDAGLDSEPMQTRNRVNSGGLENEKRWAPVEARNIHPTVKPISLCKYLATLLLPPEEYSPRRILVPFSGSGSEMIGTTLAGWEDVIGIEMSPEYAKIARARLAWWANWARDGQTDIDTILGQVEEERALKESGQRRLFED